MKAGKSYNTVESALALWESVGLSGILYGCEVGVLNATSLKKLETIHAEMGKWIIGVDRESVNAVVLNELGWQTIETTIMESKLEYVKRLFDLPNENWARQVYSYIVVNQIETKWYKKMNEIRKEKNINLSSGKIKDKIEKWKSDKWHKEIGSKPSLGLYHGKKMEKGEKDI